MARVLPVRRVRAPWDPLFAWPVHRCRADHDGQEGTGPVSSAAASPALDHAPVRLALHDLPGSCHCDPGYLDDAGAGELLTHGLLRQGRRGRDPLRRARAGGSRRRVADVRPRGGEGQAVGSLSRLRWPTRERCPPSGHASSRFVRGRETGTAPFRRATEASLMRIRKGPLSGATLGATERRSASFGVAGCRSVSQAIRLISFDSCEPTGNVQCGWNPLKIPVSAVRFRPWALISRGG